MQILADEGGERIIEIFANPHGGPERLMHVQALWNKIAPKSIVKVDSAKAYEAAAMDDWEKDIWVVQISHNKARVQGLSWWLVLETEEELARFGHLVEEKGGLLVFRVTNTNQNHLIQRIVFKWVVENIFTIYGKL